MKHNQKIVEQFTLQAKPFAEVPSHGDALEMIQHLGNLAASDTVLDVACGPGLVACAFAANARHVTGIDITPRMIAEAQQRQQKLKLENMSWVTGDVLPLPFPDAHFSLVLTRYSFHHFLQPAAVLAEMIRVCKPRGRVMVVDVAVRADKVDAFNRMERLRDPSHAQALAPEALITMMQAELDELRTTQYNVEMELEKQLAASFPDPGDEIRLRHLFADDVGLDLLGLGVHRVGHALHFAYPVLAIAGVKRG